MAKAQGRRQLQKEATREHIIKTAMLVYREQGFSATTNMVAQKAGVAHGTIFVHFPKREDLLLHALERFADDMGKNLHELSSVSSGIEALLRGHIDIIQDNEPFYKNLIMEISSLPFDTKNMLIVLNATAAHHFGTAARRGMEDGKVKMLPIHMLYNTWIGLIHYYLQNSELFAPDGESVIKRYKSELVSGYMKLIEK